jgi:large subunit ribosomal protein L27
MAHKKAGGSSRNGRDSNSKRLGVKKFGGEAVISGNIICVSAARSGIPVPMLASAPTTRFLRLTEGTVNYRTKANGRVYVSVMPKTAAAAE